MAGKVQFYEDNILNGYDNVTYNWTMYMVRPEDVNKYDQVINSNNVKIIAQSGVEAEINIQSVQQNLIKFILANAPSSLKIPAK